MEELNEISLVSDTVFKFMYKDNNYRSKMIKAIKRYTNIDLTDYDLINNEISSGTKKIKDMRMDLILEKDNHVVIIEMEQFATRASETKDYEYLYRIAGTQFEKGEEYREAKATLIRFNNFVLKELRNKNVEDEKLVDFKFMNSKYNIVKKDIESYELILPNFHKMNYNSCNEIEKFLWLFSCKSLEEMKKVVDNENDKQIVEYLERLSMDENFRFMYDNEIVQKKLLNSEKKESFEEGIQQGIEQGIQKGIEQGIHQGITESKKQSIINSHSLGIKIEDIAKIVDMTIEEVENVINNN